MFSPNSSAPAGSRRAGFTLIELLVVIAIIALLISILLPSLQNARNLSKRTKCAAHLRGVSLASRTYASEYDDWSIPIHGKQYQQKCDSPTYIGAYEWGGKSGIGRIGYARGCGRRDWESSKYGTCAGFGPGSRPLNQTIYKGGFEDFKEGTEQQRRQDTLLSLEDFLCPGDDGPPRGAHCSDWVESNNVSSYDWFGNSFSANIFMIANTTGTRFMDTNAPYLRPTTRIPSPSRVIYYEENIGRWAWACREDVCDFLVGVDMGPTRSLKGWHGKDWNYNRSFVDAHVEYQKVILEDTRDSEGYYNHYRRERMTDEGCSMGDNQTLFSWSQCIRSGRGCDTPVDQLYQPCPCRVDYRCVLIRGDGWQKDTLPSPLVHTGLVAPSEGRPSYELCVSE
ncbi:MAG: prepilin-type N-terminal cleavage/methylation domain-containing protein [Phycisphaerales bacterium]|nr:prepilin-type N-terminal cleavage/methylation domain-containing protein [Phycisphaerales bacterium]